MNPGRPPTPLGGDGIDPWITLERKLTPSLVRRMQQEGITVRVAEDGCIDDDRYGVFVSFDRLSFPGEDPAHVQAVLDGWIRDHP